MSDPFPRQRKERTHTRTGRSRARGVLSLQDAGKSATISTGGSNDTLCTVAYCRSGRFVRLGDFESARFTGPGDNFLQEYLRQSAERSFANAKLAVYSERFLGIQRYEATGLELALEGVGAAATVGLFTGALANTAGLWDEDTSWYIVGAAAALGAFLGYSRVDDPKKRTRYRWSIDVDSGNRNR
jgi:hypothetical protein